MNCACLRWPGVISVALGATLVAAPRIAASRGADFQGDVAVKAALLFNFPKYTQWPAPVAAFTLCVVGNDAMAASLVETVRGQNIDGHPLDVMRPADSATWRSCHLLFVSEMEVPRAAAGLLAVRSLPVLTVSDAKGFARAGGIIELYIEDGKMAFAINLDAAARSRLVLSSRVLRLAKIVKD